MKNSLLLSLLLAGTLGLGACQKEGCDLLHPTSTGLPGTWRLISRQCECMPAPVPNETVTFTDSTYRFTGTSQSLFAQGYYTEQAVTICGIPAPAPGLRLTDATANIGPRQAQYTIKSDTLVLDYGSPCDAPRDTYVRQQL